MAKYRIKGDVQRPPTSRFAIGVNTGTLFIMLNCRENSRNWHGVVLVGCRQFEDREGERHENQQSYFDLLPVGTVIEIET